MSSDPSNNEIFNIKRAVSDLHHYNEMKLKSNTDIRLRPQIIKWSNEFVTLSLHHFTDDTFRNKNKNSNKRRCDDTMKLYHNCINVNTYSAFTLNDHIMENIDKNFVSKNGYTHYRSSTETLSDVNYSDSVSHLSTISSVDSSKSKSSSSLSSDSHGYGSLNGQHISSIYNDRSDTTRVIQRFGKGFHDKCLFPLVLPLDASDLSNGIKTWDSIMLHSEIALKKWEISSKYNMRSMNRVLKNPVDYVCPMPSLRDKILLYPKTHLPLRRWNSIDNFLNLNHRKHESSMGKYGIELYPTMDDFVLPNQEFEVSIIDNQQHDGVPLLNGINSYELKLFRNSSLKYQTNKFLKNDKSQLNAKTLARNIRINSPISIAIQVTEIDRKLFLQLKSVELFEIAIGKRNLCRSSDLTGLKTLMQFGEELNNLVLSVIRKEIDSQSQSKKIAGFIEVACVLRKLRNWHSLCIIIRALQSPKIYFMEEAWMITKNCYRVHYNDYLKLCRLVRSSETCMIRSLKPSIPSLFTLVTQLRYNCVAMWDLIENKRRWTEPPGIAHWLQEQLIGQILASHKVFTMDHGKDTSTASSHDRCSLLPQNDPIYLINPLSLPIPWIKSEARNIPYVHIKIIIKSFLQSYNEEMKIIKRYNIRRVSVTP